MRSICILLFCILRVKFLRFARQATSVSSDITIKYINETLKKLDSELKAICAEMLLLEKKDKNNSQSEINLCECFSKWNSFSLEDKKSLARIFIERVEVTDSEINIFFN